MNRVAYGALWLFVFSVPWERVLVITGVSVGSRIAGALALLLALLAVVISARLRRWRAFHICALLFVIWVGFGVMVLQPEEVPKKFYTFVQLFLAIWMIWELAPDRRRQVGLLIAYMLGAYVAALDTIYIFAREGGSLNRFASAGADPNSLAMNLALGLPMAWYLGMSHHRALVRWIGRAYLPISLLAITLTGSRGGMITAFLALLIVPLTLPNLSPGKVVTAIALLVLSGALTVAYVPENIVERLATTGESVQSLSLGGRFRLWRAGMHAFFDQPLMGYGTSAFRRAITPELGYMAQVAHNSYLSVLVEEGLVGLLLFLSIIGMVFLDTFRLPRLERRFALVLLATLCVAMLPLTWEDEKPVWIVMAALVGLSHAADVRRPARPLRQFVPRPVGVGGPAAAGHTRSHWTTMPTNTRRDGRT
ncbi:MAG TPA: O-antigen ligase family protein [Gemmatimonadales bacterium]|nr:O-antigen ligase family protein [Gemmatimonadales bacterium]